jgi:WD40 repeat protein
MRSCHRLLTRAFISVALLAAVLVLTKARAADTEEATIDNLVKQLGSDDAAERQKAAKRLEEIGEPALAALRRAAKSDLDPDLRLRAGVVASAIEKKNNGEVRRFEGHTTVPGNVAISRDGKFAVSGDSNTIHLWDLATGKSIRTFKGHTNIVQNLAFSPDGKKFLSTSRDGTVRQWDVESGKELKQFQAPEGGKVARGEIWDVTYSPDGKEALTAGAYGHTCCWDAESGQEVKRYPWTGGFVKSAVFSPDGKTILASIGTNIHLLNKEDGKQITAFLAHKQEVRQVMFTPDGKQFVSGDSAGEVRLWDVEKSKEIRKFEGHSGPIHGIAFTPDGKRLVTGSYDQTLRLWEVETGKEIFRFTADDKINWVALTPDGSHALLTCFDKTLRLVKLPAAKKPDDGKKP